MQQFGRELEQLPERGRRLAEQAMSSISTVNHRSKRSSVSQRSSKSNSGVEEDSFVRIVNTLVDLSPRQISSKPIIETFVLSSVILTVFSLSSLLGGYILAPFISFLIPPVGAAIFSGLVAPLAIYYQLSTGYGPLNGFRLLVIATTVQGVLTGSALSHVLISAEPFVALSTIASSFIIAVMNPTSRASSLSTTVATSILIHSTLGAVEGALTPVYFVLTGFYTLAALIPIQLASRDQSRANVNLYSAILVGLTISAKCLVYGVLGAYDVPISASEEQFGLEGNAEINVNA